VRHCLRLATAAWLATSALVAAPAVAQDNVDAEIRIYDADARWAGTEWFIETEVVLPWVTILSGGDNQSFRTSQYQLRTHLRCDRLKRVRRRRRHVDCVIAEIGLQVVAVKDDSESTVAAVLEDVDMALTGASLQLHAHADGRIVGLALHRLGEGLSTDRHFPETLRMLMSRVVVGFTMKLPENHDLNDGIWVEFNSDLMSMPTEDATSRGTNEVAHQMTTHASHAVVESTGRGMTQVGDFFGQNTMPEMTFQMSYAGVAIYDRDLGYMNERVWRLVGTPAILSARYDEGRVIGYAHTGRLLELRDDGVHDVGPTRQIAEPDTKSPTLAPYTPFDF
jgi:hypothetical protein